MSGSWLFFRLPPLFLLFIIVNGNPFADIKGDFCRRRIGGCCPGRIDECSVPILGTLCYCDGFCNRTENPDCCPDYNAFCLGHEPIELDPPENLKSCSKDGRNYEIGSKLKINCNECKCEMAGSPIKAEFLCETEPCLLDESSIEEINNGKFYWTAGNHSDFWGKTLAKGILMKLGTLEPERAVRRMEPIKAVYDPTLIPRAFDARTKWPTLISRVRDQEWCGADWAITTAAVIQDRLAIQSGGSEIVSLAPQQILACNNRGQQGCKGGHLDRSWNFMRRFGVVPETCYPYTGTDESPCRISRNTKRLSDIPTCEAGNSINVRSELYRSGPPYRVGTKETDIQHEIMNFGPVQATLSISADFFSYKNGIYKRSGLRVGQRTGWHSVRIIGWGEEFLQGSNVKYWIASNSWGVDWGEEGHFRILRGVNECEVESFVVAAWARPDAHSRPRTPFSQ